MIKFKVFLMRFFSIYTYIHTKDLFIISMAYYIHVCYTYVEVSVDIED